MPLPLAKAMKGFSPQPEPSPARSICRSQLEQDVSHRPPLFPLRPPAYAFACSPHSLTWNARTRAQVKRLRKVLQEETALHAVLEGALGRAAVTLADMAYLPTNVRPHASPRLVWPGLASPAAVADIGRSLLSPLQAQELLSNICILETAVKKMEEEMVSLHFQLIQERNERRLVEYRLKHLPPQPSACSCHSGKLGPDVRIPLLIDISVPAYNSCKIHLDCK